MLTAKNAPSHVLYHGNKTMILKEKQMIDVKWYTYDEVISMLETGDKVAFLIRHSQKSGDNLTENGIAWVNDTKSQITTAGLSVNSFDYYSSGASYCDATLNQFGALSYSTLDCLNKYFYYNSSSINNNRNIISAYAYCHPTTGSDELTAEHAAVIGCNNTEASINEHVNLKTSLLMDVILNKLHNTQNNIMMVTHDDILVPFTVTISGKGLHMRAYMSDADEKEWISFMGGTAIILRADGTFRAYPITSGHEDPTN